MVALSRLTFFAFLALSGLSSAHAAGGFKPTKTGQTTTIFNWDTGASQPVAPLNNTITITPGSSPTITHGNTITVGPSNKNVIIDVEAKIKSKPDFAKSALKFGKLLPVVGNIIQAAELVEFLKDELASDSVTLKNDNGSISADIVINSSVDSEFVYKVSGSPSDGIYPSISQACQAAANSYSSITPQYWDGPGSMSVKTCVEGTSWALKTGTSGGVSATDSYSFSVSKLCSANNSPPVNGACPQVDQSTTRTLTEPEIQDAIANKQSWPDSVKPLLQRMLKDPSFTDVPIDPSTIKTSGPASVPGEKVTTSESVRLVPGTTTETLPSATTPTDPGTKTTTATQTTKLTYQGNTVNYNTTNTNSVTNITNNTTNITETTNEKTETTEDKPPEDGPPFCELYPESIVCKSLGALEPVPISNLDKPLQITPDTGWGPQNGTCPPPRTIALATIGKTLELSFQPLCDFATGLRPVVIALAWLSATFGFMAIGRKS